METIKDKALWKLAKKRVSFKRHLAMYILINGYFWGSWYFDLSSKHLESEIIPWPLWSMLGWGIGLAFHYTSAYLKISNTATEKEYNKLVSKENSL